MLRKDAALEPVGSLTWFSGRDTCMRYVSQFFGAPGDWQMEATAANGQPAAAAYLRGPDGVHRAFGLAVLTVTATGIARIVRWMTVISAFEPRASVPVLHEAAAKTVVNVVPDTLMSRPEPTGQEVATQFVPVPVTLKLLPSSSSPAAKRNHASVPIVVGVVALLGAATFAVAGVAMVTGTSKAPPRPPVVASGSHVTVELSAGAIHFLRSSRRPHRHRR